MQIAPLSFLLLLFLLFHATFSDYRFQAAHPFTNTTLVYRPISLPYTMHLNPYFENMTDVNQFPISGFAHRSLLTYTKLYVVYVGFNYTGTYNLTMQDMAKPSTEAISESLFDTAGPTIYHVDTPTFCTSSIVYFRRDPYTFLLTCPELVNNTTMSDYLNAIVSENR